MAVIDGNDGKEVIPEKTVYKAVTLSGTVPVGKTLKVQTSPTGVEIYKIKPGNGVALKYAITVAIEEA